METAFSLSSSSSLPSLKIPRNPSRNPNLHFNLFTVFFPSCSSRKLDSISIKAVSASPSSTSPPSKSSSWISARPEHLLLGGRRLNDLSVQVTSDPDNTGDDSREKAIGKFFDMLELGFVIVCLYYFNICFNIYTKQVLKVYPYPITMSALQFAFGTLLTLFMWAINYYKKPKISTPQLVAIFPLAVAHTLGCILTNMHLKKYPISFIQTFKSMEPFLSVVFSALLFNEMPTLTVVSSLVPVLVGVTVISITEASLNWFGLYRAMASNLSKQYRNVFSKKLMAKKEEPLDYLTLFSILTIMSFILTIPVTLLMEGVKFTPLYLKSAVLDYERPYVIFFLAVTAFHAYHHFSFHMMHKAPAGIYPVINWLKRAVVIVGSLHFFQIPVSPIDSFAIGMTLAGGFLYSMAKLIKPKPKPKTT